MPQAELLRKGETAFLVTGDVYRRDTVDATHYPCFHQMECVRVHTPSEWEAAGASQNGNSRGVTSSYCHGPARTLSNGIIARGCSKQAVRNTTCLMRGSLYQIYSCHICE